MADAANRFETCLSCVLTHEGGFVDNKADPGGATNLGITRKTLARWRNIHPWWRVKPDAVKALRRPEAARIYKSLYWDRSRAGLLPTGLDLAVFDHAVHSGPAAAVKALQRELGVKPDGLVGPLSLTALRARVAMAGIAGLIDALCDRRLGFLQRLAVFSVFGRGWTRRVAAIRAAAHKASGADTSASTVHNGRRPMSFLTGSKTYIVAAAMLLAATAQLMGVDLPAFDGHSAGQLAMEAFAIIFLRRGIKSEIGNA